MIRIDVEFKKCEAVKRRAVNKRLRLVNNHLGVKKHKG